MTTRRGKESLTGMDSSFTYHLAAAAWCRSESSCATYIHSGAKEYVGENHKVRTPGYGDFGAVQCRRMKC
jgi:hypothetical protein